MIRKILAVIAGLGVAVVTFSVVQSINGLLFAPSSPVDYNDKNAVAALIASMPVAAFVTLLGGYVFGSLLAGWLVGRLLQSQSRLLWSVISVVDLIFTGMVIVLVLVAVSLFQGLPTIIKTLLPFLILGAGIIGGVFLGRVASGIRSRPVGIAEAVIIGVLLTAAWVMNITSIPHPPWVVAVGFFCFIPPVLLGRWIASRSGSPTVSEAQA